MQSGSAHFCCRTLYFYFAINTEQYNSTMPMSRQGLIDQLIYEGHGQDDSAYAVDQLGL
ncbi:Ltp family lipoprotein [uncultured Metabacillus sp.]|uniref:Ltp family lipoprotein n=1 Tax=uncultured Metabacillus sp. TaxID=2860135 RepID=UPI002638B078|nr:Ltp family lipoprotein [uncultured Metabacillus sp.]